MKNEINMNSVAISGGVDVKLSNGSSVRLKPLPIRKFSDMANAMGDEPKLVELFAGLSPEEVDAVQ